jgi:hypothetical protein
VRFAAGKLSRRRGGTRPDLPPVASPTAAEALADADAIGRLLDGAEVSASGYSTPRSVEYLRWRYGSAPLLGYHAVVEQHDGDLVGMAFFRLRPEGSLWGLSLADVIVRPGDVGSARNLLRSARGAADVSYVAATFPDGSTALRATRGPTSIRAPHGMTFVANPLRSDLVPDPLQLSSWSLSTGDVEVF